MTNKKNKFIGIPRDEIDKMDLLHLASLSGFEIVFTDLSLKDIKLDSQTIILNCHPNSLIENNQDDTITSIDFRLLDHGYGGLKEKGLKPHEMILKIRKCFLGANHRMLEFFGVFNRSFFTTHNPLAPGNLPYTLTLNACLKQLIERR